MIPSNLHVPEDCRAVSEVLARVGDFPLQSERVFGGRLGLIDLTGQGLGLGGQRAGAAPLRHRRAPGGLDGNVSVGGYDVFVTKYDAAGVKQWARQLGSASDDVVHGVATDSAP